MLFPILPLVRYRFPIFIEVFVSILPLLLLCIPFSCSNSMSSSNSSSCFSCPSFRPSSPSFSPSSRSLFNSSSHSSRCHILHPLIHSFLPFFLLLFLPILSSSAPSVSSSPSLFIIHPSPPSFVSLLPFVLYIVLPLGLSFLPLLLPRLLPILLISVSLAFTPFFLLPPSLSHSSFC